MAAAEGRGGDVFFHPNFEENSNSEAAALAFGPLLPVVPMTCLDKFKLKFRKGSTLRTSIPCPVVGQHPVTNLAQSSEKSASLAQDGRFLSSYLPESAMTTTEESSSRKLSTNEPYSYPSSPGSSESPHNPITRRTTTMELVKSRIRDLQQARLYLLQEISPHTFIVGGDSREHKYHVVIGPQTCSCNQGPHCVHLLFVMLRVFQIPESDSRIYAKKLKSFEVETLFYNYHLRRNSRVNGPHEDAHSSTQNGMPLSDALESNNSGRSSDASDIIVDEDRCPICLLEMVDGESMVTCTTSCRNKLHHHCMAIWAEESYQQCDAVLCPLCRQPWICEAEESDGFLSSSCALKKNLPPNESPQGSASSSDSPSPKAAFPMEHVSSTSEWIRIFGSIVINGLNSHDWKIREKALRRVGNRINSSQKAENKTERDEILHGGAKIIVMMVVDPVYKVFSNCMRCFRVLVNQITCHYPEDFEEVLELLQPVIDAFLFKCADCRPRVAHRSMDVLMELTEGPKSDLSLQGIHLLLASILQNWTWKSVGWQWLAGRLILLDRLIKAFPEEFWLQQPPRNLHFGHNTDGCSRLISIVKFAFRALRSPHSTVAKLARHVFVLSSIITAREPIIFNKVLEMLSGLDPSLQKCLRRRLNQAASSCTSRAQKAKATFELPLQKDSCHSESQNVFLKPVLDRAIVNGHGGAMDSCFTSSDLPLNTRTTWNKEPVKPPTLSVSSSKRNCKLMNILSGNVLPTKPELSELTRPNSNHFQGSTNIQSPPPLSTIEEVIIPLDLDEICHKKGQDILFEDRFPSLNNNDHDQVRNLYIEGMDWKKGQLLGTGAFSSCYQAQDTATGFLMAVKQVSFHRNSDEEQTMAENRIQEEIVIMAKLRHCNILRIYGATKRGSHFNMFVEWMAGGSVAGMLKKYGAFTEQVIISYTKQILEGLSYLHDNHILHRDLKGANLLIDSTGHHLRIGDFGTAGCLMSQTTTTGEFQGQLLGTIAFMAPEVLRGESYGRSCDIWGVGCCVIEMASTKHPWQENCVSNCLALIYKIASSVDPPSVPENLSQEVKDLALRCLQMDCKLRPSAKDLLDHDCFVSHNV